MNLVIDTVMGCLPIPSVSRAGSLSAAAEEDYDGEDRISELPYEILCDIVSRLPVKDAARTRCVSSRWHHVWHSAPLVLYDEHLVPARDREAGERISEKHFAAIGSVLAQHPGPFRVVHLSCCCFESYLNELYIWSGLLAARDVHGLVLVNQPIPMDMILPPEVFGCAALRRLYLGFWALPEIAGLPDGGAVFPHLRELGLLMTGMTGKDLEHMLASSPLLEKLLLVCSRGMPQLVRLRGQSLRCVLFCKYAALEIAVMDAPLLERLILHKAWVRGCEVLRISMASAPRLQVLGYLDAGEHGLKIGSTVIKVDTKESPDASVPSVKILAVKVNLGAFSEVNTLYSFLRCFPHIETRHLQSHIKNLVLHEFLGDRYETSFLKNFCGTAKAMQKLTLVVSDEKLASLDVMKTFLRVIASHTANLSHTETGQCCMVLLVEPAAQQDWDCHKSSDLLVNDPFLPQQVNDIQFSNEGE
ncbi:F-box/FBD/LRR-repeat protein At5g53840 isoform X2 [Brachypodium distachyon]|uniref:F-box domain-containing protein n=1 Tax=Brachypodium distachyon TaxID=15368 RepID=A0A2K2DD31_BRADI|nr:F-box/FBD/LRR-repeat protein At5g53840 isoform X2 [Brachypodium distachyon]PNT72195.1 hypothetical protein BRADI_2g41170v3 [Brachypodium distachyon]|eukprot:XP_024315372.1 F-box/FBD/LRR-repeat protein At5g53840 isoform X2 [Brachypodium distachyon]